ncbi:hypothetical protein [Clostridium algoriphilum]|nr:hypothetical protein [Clostridium algoriphilum]
MARYVIIPQAGKEKFIHKAYESTLIPVYGANYEENLVIEGGKIK